MQAAIQKTVSLLSIPNCVRSIPMKLPGNLGMVLLAVWLILFGILTAPFLKISFNHSGDILAVLAIAAGALLLRNR